MRALHPFFTRLRNFAATRRGDERLREEMQEHIALQTEENLSAGMPPSEARRQALLKFGAVEAVREQYHAEEGLPLLETLLQDVRYALRQLRRSPGLRSPPYSPSRSASARMPQSSFFLAHAVLIRKLPVADPRTLVRLGDRNDCCIGYDVPDDADYSVFSTQVWKHLQKSTPEFQDLAAMESGFESHPIVVRHDGSQQDAHAVMGEFVSGNYFRTFGLQPFIGRLFSGADDTPRARLRRGHEL